jgi:hypothetical protein
MTKVMEKFPIRGFFNLWVYRNGILIEEIHDHNRIVNGARRHAARLFAGDVEGMSIAGIAFGTNGTAPADTDTTITGTFEKAVSGFDYPENGRVRAAWELLVTENNGMAIMEFGLIAADGTLLARIVRDPGKPLHKESDISLEGFWGFEF